MNTRRNIGMEPLESRQMMSVSVINGTLTINGDNGLDGGYVSAAQSNGQWYYRFAGRAAGVTYERYFLASTVSKIQFRGYGGNDDFRNNTFLPSTMFGGEGNDTLVGGFRSDTIYGENGGDRITDQTNVATTNWDNWFYGGDGADLIGGTLGNDVMFGGNGNDSLGGGNASDYLSGDADNDLIEGGWGRDYCYGGTGNDTLAGQGDVDTISGGAGFDVVWSRDSGVDYVERATYEYGDFNAAERDTWY